MEDNVGERCLVFKGRISNVFFFSVGIRRILKDIFEIIV